MPTYVAFLRAINLGAHRKFGKDAIKSCAEGAGFTGVETYINTGNLRIDSGIRSRIKVETVLERAFATERGFEVPTIVFSTTELREINKIADEITELRGEDDKQYIWLLKGLPDPEVTRLVEGMSTEFERAFVRGRGIHLLLRTAYHSAVLGSTKIEKIVGTATNRNVNVIRAVTERWC